MRFDVLDEARLRSALNAEPGLEGDGDTWCWTADDMLLGEIRLAGPQLTVTTYSEPRADRARQLIEGVARDAVAYRDADDRCEGGSGRGDSMRARAQAAPDAEDQIPPEIQDQLFQEFMAKHDQQSARRPDPRARPADSALSAQSPALRPRLVGLLKEIETNICSPWPMASPPSIRPGCGTNWAVRPPDARGCGIRCGWRTSR